MILCILSLTNLSDLWVFALPILAAVILVAIDEKRPILVIHRMIKVSAYVTISYILAAAASLHKGGGFEIIFLLTFLNMIISSIVLIVRIYMSR